MKFIYAKELKTKFEAHGHFYQLRLNDFNFICRSVLEIKRKHLKNQAKVPDIVIIMMNPGSSSPLHEKDRLNLPLRTKNKEPITTQLIPAKPDSTQYQIMRLMEIFKWNLVRIINLSDLRNGNSKAFVEQLKKVNLLDQSNHHSITSKNRRKELIRNLNSETNLILAAWGKIKELNSMAANISELNLDSKKIIGLKQNSPQSYYHPSPLQKTAKLRWLKEIKRVIKNEQALT